MILGFLFFDLISLDVCTSLGMYLLYFVLQHLILLQINSLYNQELSGHLLRVDYRSCTGSIRGVLRYTYVIRTIWSTGEPMNEKFCTQRPAPNAFRFLSRGHLSAVNLGVDGLIRCRAHSATYMLPQHSRRLGANLAMPNILASVSGN